MRFNPLDHPAAFMRPQLLNVGSAWLEHIPFAFLLMDLARPQLLVELGTYKGDSYCAFCQAIASLKFPARCFGVDTWAGDPHMGVLPQDVLTKLRAHHDPLYGSFSTLLQKSFDDAAGQFEDGSIDLLHIDGTHTFQAVQHDFQTWRPKLSDSAIVLLHDITVAKPDFGVDKFWAQIHPEFPSFEFKHCFGLGILAVGKNPPARFAEFLEEAQSNPDAMRDCFAALGNRNDAHCWLIGVLQVLCGQQQMHNQFKRHIGAPLDPSREEFQQALDNPVEYAINLSRELQLLANDDLALRQALSQARQALSQAQAAPQNPR